jgi:hypothetical protein
MVVRENLDLSNVIFGQNVEIILDGAEIRRRLIVGLDDSEVGNVESTSRTSSAAVVSLRGTDIDELVDTAIFWGLGGSGTPVQLDLVDFTYQRFGSHADQNVDASRHSGVGALTWQERLEWIRLQTRTKKAERLKNHHGDKVNMTKGNYVPQPYQQLASVYGAMGRDSERRHILIAQQDDLRLYGELGWTTGCFNWLMSKFAGHGYRPLRSLGLTIIIYLLAVGCVWIPKHHNAFVASVAFASLVVLALFIPWRCWRCSSKIWFCCCCFRSWYCDLGLLCLVLALAFAFSLWRRVWRARRAG